MISTYSLRGSIEVGAISSDDTGKGGETGGCGASGPHGGEPGALSESRPGATGGGSSSPGLIGGSASKSGTKGDSGTAVASVGVVIGGVTIGGTQSNAC
nr:hypothetical protein Iba_chr13dCG3100 [Ipomoea batatas]